MKSLKLFLIACLSFYYFPFYYAQSSLDYTDFNSVSVGHNMELILNQSDKYSVKLSGDDDELNNLKIEKKKNSLRFYFEDNYRQRGKVRIEITMPDLENLNLSGRSKGKLNFDTKGENLNLNLSGQSELQGKLIAAKLNVNLSGDSRAELDGTGGNMNANLSGSSKAEMKNFTIKDLIANLSGSSKVIITMDGNLTANGSGSSKIIYYGKANVAATRFSGSAGVSKGS